MLNRKGDPALAISACVPGPLMSQCLHPGLSSRQMPESERQASVMGEAQGQRKLML